MRKSIALFVALVLVVPASAQDVASLKKEIELLKRENELFRRENELLRRENEELKKSADRTPREGKSIAKAGAKEPITKVVVDDVEYVFSGLTRSNNGATATATVIATSLEGNHKGPWGAMALIDENGDRYLGHPVGVPDGFITLREGVPVKMQWRFSGSNALVGPMKSNVPPQRVTQFASVTIFQTVANNPDQSIDFRNVPATLSQASTGK